jgi:hypothetical protein
VLVMVPLLVASACGAQESEPRPSAPAGTSGETSPGATDARDASLPQVAEVACVAGATKVLTPRVRAQRDGIHVRFDNETGEPLGYSVLTVRGGGGGDDVPVRGTEVVVALPPGELQVVCFDPDSRDDPSEQERARVEAVDALGLWTPTTLSSTCESAVSTTSDYAAGAAGEAGPPAEVARHFLQERDVLEPGDVVEDAGYPDQEQAVVRLARAGETLAVLDFLEDGEGGLLLSTVTACTGIGLG